MSWIKDNFLGGAAKNASEAQQRALVDAQGLVRQATEDAQGYATDLFSSGNQAGQESYQMAANMLGGMSPQIMQLAQQGNMNAQNTLAQSAPQFQNAILGGQIDYSFLQPQALEYDTSMFNNPQTQWSQAQAAQEQAAQDQANQIQTQTSQNPQQNWYTPMQGNGFNTPQGFNPRQASFNSGGTNSYQSDANGFGQYDHREFQQPEIPRFIPQQAQQFTPPPMNQFPQPEIPQFFGNDVMPNRSVF